MDGDLICNASYIIGTTNLIDIPATKGNDWIRPKILVLRRRNFTTTLTRSIQRPDRSSLMQLEKSLIGRRTCIWQAMPSRGAGDVLRTSTANGRRCSRHGQA